MARSNGGKTPQALLDRPVITQETAWFLDSFFMLSSSRSQGMSIGSIPLSEITNYALIMGTIGWDIKDFCSIMTRLDSSYLGHVNSKSTTPKSKK